MSRRKLGRGFGWAPKFASSDGSSASREFSNIGPVAIRESTTVRVRPAPNARDMRLAELFRREAEFVWRVVRRLGVPDAEAEDAVQEVFLAVAKQLDAYEERGALRAWLVAIARQVAYHAQRTRFRHERKRRAPLPQRSEVSDDPQRRLECQEAVAFIHEFLAEIEPDQALVFYLAEVEGMPVVEIAASLNANLNTIYGRLRLARKRFSTRIKDMSPTDR